MTIVVFAGGGSGGHLFPGIAVAEELVRRNPECECLFIGSNRAIEAEIIRPYGFRHQGLCVPSSSAFYRSPLRSAKSFWQGYRLSSRLIDASKPRVVVGLGGNFSVPTILAAARRKIPILLLEQNAVLGRANRLLLPLAHHLCLSYAQTSVPGRYVSRVSMTGNPVRREIVRARPRGLNSDRSCLLILGGSQGAKAINEVVLRALSRLGPTLSGWQIVHQTGKEELEVVRSRYRNAGILATVVPFLSEIGSIYSQTALAISRAGGTTLAELAGHSIPAILIPYPGSIRDHQAWNAKQYEQAGGAVTVPQLSDLEATAHRLCEVLPSLLKDRDSRAKRGNAMFSLACPGASERVADLIQGYCSGVGSSTADCGTSRSVARAS
jgi:UDP-N-acetylglucosamine--N-acetylmuramyl-(pentapeptide) pyrophosphoryl-undecaprenol N-acetylglucosamine transferase